MAPRLQRSRVRSAVFSTALLLAGAAAQAAPLDLGARQAPPTEPDLVKALPASHDELVFRGETSGATWPIYFSRTEATRTTAFQIGLLNTVSLLPERSSIRIAINGRTLATLPIRSPEKVSTLPIRIPPGLLVPGFNAVEISVAMTHRVDCSVKATYELWTLLDPASTGFLLPAQAAAAPRTLEDLAAEAPAEDGTTRIHLRIAPDGDAEALNRGAGVIAALVVRSHLIRPVVDVGLAPGTGPGFDVRIDPQDGSDGLAIRRDPATRRLTVTAPAVDPANGGAIAAVPRPAGTPQGIKAYENLSGLAVDGERRLSFADLGLHSESTAGRHYVNTLALTMPDDFYPGNYGRARIYLDATHASGLATAASLVFRVNGALVSSLPLGAGSPDRFDHAQVDLPLQFFRPGHNAIEMEAVMPNAADEQCDLTAAPSGPRLSIADSSELSIPRFARLQTAPQVMTTLRFGETGEPNRITDLYLTSGDPRLVGVGMTVAASMAARDRTAGALRFHLEPPAPSDRAGIVVGPVPELPEALATAVRKLVTMDAGGGAPDSSASSEAPPATALAQMPAREQMSSLLASAQQWLRSKGYFYTASEGERATVPLSEHGFLVADVQAEQLRSTLAGIELPQFTTSSQSWVVVTGQTSAGVADGIGAFVANSHWKDLSGEAVAFDAASGALHAVQPVAPTYVVPDAIVLGDLRPILGGIMSSNILLSAVALLLLLALLGLSTHALLRVSGERSKR